MVKTNSNLTISKSPTININLNTNQIDEINKKIMEEIFKPKPVFVAFATVDGPSLTKVMYR